MNKKLIFAAVAAIGVLGLAGCGSSNGSQPTSGGTSQPAQSNAQGSDQGSGNSSQGNSADANKTTATNATASAGDAAKGKDIFAQSCAGCHSVGSDKIVGPGLKGESAKATIDANGKPMNDANLADWIKTGGTGKIGNMPGMGGTLSDQQIADVVAYMKTLK